MSSSQEVGLFEAKTKLSSLVERVEGGEEITITRRGVPVARLVPMTTHPRKPIKQVIAEIRELRKGIKLGKVTIRELIEEGRRY